MKENKTYPIIIGNQIETEYKNANRCIGFCEEIKEKVVVEGEKSLELINHFISPKMKNDDESICSYFKTKLHFVDEIIIYKLNIRKYLILTNDSLKIIKMLKKIKRKYPITIINQSSKIYSVFSFFGERSNEYFNSIDYNHLFKITHQRFQYYQLISYKKDRESIIKHFLNLNFVQISLATKSLFLYNNNVVISINDLKRKYKKAFINHYSLPITTDKSKKKISIDNYEVTTYELVFKNDFVYNNKRKKTGIISNVYRLPNKKYLFVLVIGFSNDKYLITKNLKKEILLKKLYK